MQFFVSASLSSQISDVAVNRAVKRLFYDLDDDSDIHKFEIYDFFYYLYPIGCYRVKSYNLYRSLKLIAGYYGGIPSEHSALIKLPGVGEKIARVIAASLFSRNLFPVDRHIARILSRVCLISIENVVNFSRYIETVLWDKRLFSFSNRLIEHGRKICRSRHPLCNKCTIIRCKSRGMFTNK